MSRPDRDVAISKKMAYLLRHAAPQHFVVQEGGWVQLDDFLEVLNQGQKDQVTEEDVRRVVLRNDKQRYKLDRGRIRASQGHSFAVDLQLVPKVPPDVLYHGTAEKLLPTILHDGVKPMNRTYVHLSADVQTALRVGQRHGKPVVLKVAAKEMQANGIAFYESDNRVWLVRAVPPKYLSIT